MVVINIERKSLEEFSNAAINWGKELNAKKVNKCNLINLSEPTYTMKTSCDYQSGTITLINKNEVISEHYDSVRDQHIVIKEAIMDLVQRPAMYPITFPVTIPAV